LWFQKNLGFARLPAGMPPRHHSKLLAGHSGLPFATLTAPSSAIYHYHSQSLAPHVSIAASLLPLIFRLSTRSRWPSSPTSSTAVKSIPTLLGISHNPSDYLHHRTAPQRLFPTNQLCAGARVSPCRCEPVELRKCLVMAYIDYGTSRSSRLCMILERSGSPTQELGTAALSSLASNILAALAAAVILSLA